MYKSNIYPWQITWVRVPIPTASHVLGGNLNKDLEQALLASYELSTFIIRNSCWGQVSFNVKYHQNTSISGNKKIHMEFGGHGHLQKLCPYGFLSFKLDSDWIPWVLQWLINSISIPWVVHADSIRFFRTGMIVICSSFCFKVVFLINRIECRVDVWLHFQI